MTTGRMHRTLVRDPAWGGRALTGTEARFFECLAPISRHVDIHPTLTLAGGIRYTADFLAWFRPDADVERPFALYDVKGSEKLARATEIQRIAALCREHPLGPLRIVWWDRKAKAWREAPPRP